jgi:transcriptional regulator with XRE-family HTH domain
MARHSTDDQMSFDRTNRIYDHVGGQLRAQRIGRGLTHAQVAKIIDMSPQQYQKYEDAQSKCSLTSLEILAVYYHVPLTSFLPEEASAPAVVNEANLLARLVSAYSLLEHTNEKLRLVQLVEAMIEKGPE